MTPPASSPMAVVRVTWWLLVVVMAWWCQQAAADIPRHRQYSDIYFPRFVYGATVYGDHDVSSPIAQVVAVSMATNVTVTYGIRQITCGEKGEEKNVDNASGMFRIIPQDGRIYTSVKTPLCGKDGLPNATWKITIEASSDYSYDTALLRVETKTDQTFPCDVREICFGHTDLRFRIVEESSPAALFVFPPGYAVNSCSHARATYRVNQGDDGDVFTVDKRSSSLVTTQRLDRDTKDHYNITITCRLHQRRGTRRTKVISNATAHVHVMDVDDNQPGLRPTANQQNVVNIENRYKGSKILSRPVELWDPDEVPNPPEIGRYHVAIETNLHNFISAKLDSKEQEGPTGVPGTLLSTNLFLKKTIPYALEGEFPLRLTWQDATADSSQDGNFASLNFTIVVIPIRLQFENLTYKAHVDTRATSLAKVQQLSVVAPPEDSSITYSIVSSSQHAQGVFQIHPITGNIYLQNETLLSLHAPGLFQYKVQAHDPATNQTASATIDIRTSNPAPGGYNNDSSICDPSLCASHMNDEACVSGCGPGAPSGRCQWRSQLRKRWSRRFATCSPDLQTCPDFVCDEMEQDHPELCPQDCTYNVIGLARMNVEHVPARGVSSAAGPCHCGTPRTCTCGPAPSGDASIPSIQTSGGRAQAPTQASDTVIYKDASVKQRFPNERKPGVSGCAFGCQLAIGLGMAAAVSATLAGVILSRRFSKARPKDESEESPAFAVPSIYVNSTYRYRRPSFWDSVFPDTVVVSGGYSPLSWVDAKWEIPRENIVLGETIGEGEFGKVVKAQARSMGTGKGVSTVAVKMLKDFASASEMRDLISELELLAQVSHPNIIKLLGACTENGPVYVVVEYAKHGCLRDFLRSNRKDAILFLDDNYPNSSSEEDGLMPKDLLSFAWQITKGMQYLAEMKLVHRDLAARNVLVADKYIMKISDFGLTRDVYEEDAYMKKSKGRVPVKWLAIESLFDNIYTTKSDVWSFGVLLWEIVTLGATPYPGIPPERICELLKTGFRMLRPTGCSEKLYSIMLKCWQESSEARPTFSELCTELDVMLSENREYLAIVPDTTKDSDIKNGNVSQWVADSLAHIQREADLYPPEDEERVPYVGLALPSDVTSDTSSDLVGRLTPARSSISEDQYELPSVTTTV